MPRSISPMLVRYIKLGHANRWAEECFERGIIRFGFDTEKAARFRVCSARDWIALRGSFLREGNPPNKATEFTNEIRDFFEDDGTTLWITFHADKMHWCFLDKNPPKPHSDGIGIYRSVAKEWKWVFTDLRGRKLSKDRLPHALTKVIGYLGTCCDVEVPEYVVERINGRTTKQAQSSKILLKDKPVRARVLPLKDDEDIQVLQEARTRRSRRIHNRLTNWIKEKLASYRLTEGTASNALFDVMIEQYNESNDDLLVEVKSSVETPHIRMAVGQLYSYWFNRFEKKEPHLAILVPEIPHEQDLIMLEWLGIGVLWQEGDRMRTNTSWLRHLSK